MTEFRINKFITLELEGKDTVIYVSGKRFQQCMYLFLVIPVDNLDQIYEIESIDEVAEELDRSINPKYSRHMRISPEEEFWAHCSNIQAFYENNYNTKILHRNLAFPLLMKLYEAEDPKAIKVFKEEIAQRLSSDHENTVLFLLENNYQFFLTTEEFDTVYHSQDSEKKTLIKEFIHDRFNDNKTDIELQNKLFEYIKVMCSKQELQKYQYVTFNERKYFVREGGLTINEKGIIIDRIGQIKGLSKLKGLKRLTILRTLITSTAGLEGLTQLEHLDLCVNRVKIIEGLNTLINLKSLKLSYNQIEKISGLETLKNLEELLLNSNQITEIKGLESLTKLKKLTLHSNLISEIKGLATLLNVEQLNLSRNKISRIKGLEGVIKLNYLDLNRNSIEKIEGLTSLKELESLVLENNCISKIRGLDNLSKLKSLNLGKNKITEMEGLDTLNCLTSLWLDKNQILEMKGLDELRNLREVNLQENLIYGIRGINEFKSLEYLNLYGNKLIEDINHEFEGFFEIRRVLDKQK